MNEQKVVEVLQLGNRVLGKLSSDLAVLDVDSIMDETRESMLLNQLVSDRLAGGLDEDLWHQVELMAMEQTHVANAPLDAQESDSLGGLLAE